MSPRKRSRSVLFALAIVTALALFGACRNRPGPTVEEPELRGEPDPYSATVVVTTEDGGAVEERRSSVFRSGDLFREEWSEQGETRALILRPDIGKSFLLSLDRRIYVESPVGPGVSNAPGGGEARGPEPAFEAGEIERALSAAPLGAETRRLADEVIDGHACSVTEKRESFEGGHVEVTTTFRAKDLEGLPLRIVSETDSAGRRVRVIIQRIDVRVTVDPDLFTVPANFSRVDRLF